MFPAFVFGIDGVFFLLFCRIVLLLWITPKKRTWNLKITKAPNLNGKSSSKTSFFGSQFSGGVGNLWDGNQATSDFLPSIWTKHCQTNPHEKQVPYSSKRTIFPVKVSCSRVEIFPSQEDLSGKTSGPRPGNLLKIDCSLRIVSIQGDSLIFSKMAVSEHPSLCVYFPSKKAIRIPMSVF